MADPAQRPYINMLGDMQVASGSGKHDLTGKAADLLAVLIVRRAHPSTISALIDALWDGSPPRTARSAIQTYLSWLRKLLGASVRRSHLTESAYQLVITDETLDAAQFEAYVRAGRSAAGSGDHVLAVHYFGTAGALWGGDPYRSAHRLLAIEGDRQRLLELRAGQLEDECASALELGHHEQRLHGLRLLVDEAPMRERRTALLMLALYRSGRQAEAIEAAQTLDRWLLRELGLRAGHEVRSLETAILQQADRLEFRSVAGVARRAPLPGILVAAGAGFVGRNVELDRIATSSAGVIILVGEPGIGKTALAGILAREAAERGEVVLYGWSDATEGHTSAIRRALAPLRHAAFAYDSRYGGLVDGAISSLDVLARTTGISLILDDYQWADAPCRDLAKTVARLTPWANLRLIVLARPSETTDELRRHPGVLSIALGPLASDDVAELMEREVANGLVRPTKKQVDRVVALTGGVPLLVRAVLRRWESTGSRWIDTLDLDEPTLRLVDDSFADLDLFVLDRLTVAAVIDDPLTIEEWAGLANITIATALSDIDIARQASLLIDAPTLSFRHDLLKAALARRVDRHRRTSLHLTAWQTLTGHPDWVRARHALDAIPLLGRDEAVAIALGAAAQAEAVGEHTAAAGLCTRALALLRHDDAVPERRYELAVMASREWDLAGETSLAWVGVRDAIDVAEVANRPAWAYHAALLGVATGRSRHVEPDAVELLRRAMALQPGTTARGRANRTELRAELVTRLGYDGSDDPDLAHDVQELEQALRLPRLTRLRAPILRALLAANTSGPRIGECDAWSEELLRQRRLNDDVQSDAFAFRLRSLMQTGQVDNALRMLPAVEAFVQRTNRPVDRWGVESARAGLMDAVGDVAAAEHHATAAFLHGRRYDVADHQIAFGAQRLSGAMQSHLLGLANPTAPPESVGRDSVGVSLAIDALLLAMAGRPHDAAAVLTRAVRSLSSQPVGITTVPAWCFAAQAASLGSTSQVAAEVLTHLQRLPPHVVAVGVPPVTTLGPVTRYTGLAKALLGSVDEAIADLRRAEADCRAIPLPIWGEITAADIMRIQ